LLLLHPKQLLPKIATQNARDSGPEIEDVETLKVQKQFPQHELDFSDFPLIEWFTEAHEDEQAGHGVLEVIDDFYGLV